MAIKPTITIDKSTNEGERIKEDQNGHRGYGRLEVENNKPQFNKAIYLKET
jgi:hypothetical protein